MTIRALVVDDSPLIRAVLRETFERTNDIEVVAEAADGQEAVAQVLRVRPDIVTMDVLMPSMDGLAATQTIMQLRPTPIVIVARAGGDGGSLAIEALGRGALAVFPKPIAGFDHAATADLAETVRRLAREAAVHSHDEPSLSSAREKAGPTSARAAVAPFAADLPHRSAGPVPSPTPLAVAGIVGSTGALRTLRELLSALPASFPLPIAVVQHTERGYAQSLCAWLAEGSVLPVRLGRDGLVLLPGEVVVAPDDAHMEVRTGGLIALRGGPPVDGFRPSASVLLASLAASFGQRSLGVVLSGMGNDGAAGLRALVSAGGLAVVEDPKSAAVPGMPRRALEEVPTARMQASPGLSSLLQELVRQGQPNGGRRSGAHVS